MVTILKKGGHFSLHAPQLRIQVGHIVPKMKEKHVEQTKKPLDSIMENQGVIFFLAVPTGIEPVSSP